MKNNNEAKTWYYKIAVFPQENLIEFEKFRILNLLESQVVWWSFPTEIHISIRIDTLKKAEILLNSPFEINDIEEVIFNPSLDAMWMESQTN